MRNRKIAIFAADFGMNTNPNLMALFAALQQEGAVLDFYGSANPGGQSPDTVLKDKINIYRFPYYLHLDDSSVKALGRSLKQSISFEHRSAWQRMRAQSYDLVIGIDDLGLLAAQVIAQKSQCKLVFLSYEILFSDEITSQAERRLKRKAIAASATSALVIVQDPIRARNLVKENKLSPDIPTIHLPVSPAGGKVYDSENQYLREKFNISAEKKVVLHSGSFAEWTAAPELVSALPALQEDVVVVVHTRWNAKVRSNPFIERIQQMNLPNVVLSLDALNECEYEEMVASADVGLVLYRQSEISENIREIGFASGKFASYSRASLPVITWNHEFYRNLFTTYQCGVDVENLSDISSAVREISYQYGQYSSESARLFSEKLDFNLQWPSIKAAFNQLMDKGSIETAYPSSRQYIPV
ncbi:MAG: hypothetical protein AAGC93_10275 [Cyanobacteria bacterium P01_F01_bin.53]